ncbi:MAG: hypothetical protein MRJ65_04840 [Candidatus Brocadiaceae bacterium]|nr:hypothetical protein [Candidatus Brocadiaceae bacterium]
MVQAPEKFMEEYLRHEKGGRAKSSKKTRGVNMRKVSDAEIGRLKQNLEIIWEVYHTPEIRKILSGKRRIPFLDIEDTAACLHLSYVENGIAMEYELDLGSKKELAGAKIYKQDEMIINRYIGHKTAVADLLKTTNTALQSLATALIENDCSETDLWNAIAKGTVIHVSTDD